MKRLHSCPACGLFEWRKRKRDNAAADQALIMFHSDLARPTPRERMLRIFASEDQMPAGGRGAVGGWVDHGTHTEWVGPAPTLSRVWGAL